MRFGYKNHAMNSDSMFGTFENDSKLRYNRKLDITGKFIVSLLKLKIRFS
jgi:hypothetical protein